jgi:hypothetical protein
VSDATKEGRILMALCGITAGILDFDQIGVDEIRDTVKRSVEGSSGFLKLHRSTIVHFFQADLERFQRFCTSMGANPYLLIPHAVILHNECLVAEAADWANGILDQARRGPREMERVRQQMDRNLTRLIPNVFNYETERTLFEGGVVARGSDEYLRATRRKREELNSLIVEARTRQHEWWHLILNVLLFLITVMGVWEKLHGKYPDHGLPLVWLIALALFGVLVLVSYVREWYGRVRSAMKLPSGE